MESDELSEYEKMCVFELREFRAVEIKERKQKVKSRNLRR